MTSPVFRVAALLPPEALAPLWELQRLGHRLAPYVQPSNEEQLALFVILRHLPRKSDRKCEVAVMTALSRITGIPCDRSRDRHARLVFDSMRPLPRGAS